MPERNADRTQEDSSELAKFREELIVLIGKYSIENASDTPDYILADYIVRCLRTFASIARKRDASRGLGY